MRALVMFALCCTTLGLACGETADVPKDSQLTLESQEAEAARVFEIAQNLEKNGKAQEASDAYRQILREYPNTVQGKKAAGRIKGVPREK